jgi:hypothetical protein
MGAEETFLDSPVNIKIKTLRNLTLLVICAAGGCQYLAAKMVVNTKLSPPSGQLWEPKWYCHL